MITLGPPKAEKLETSQSVVTLPYNFVHFVKVEILLSLQLHEDQVKGLVPNVLGQMRPRRGVHRVPRFHAHILRFTIGHRHFHFAVGQKYSY
jgi:hypothetical protein